MRAADAVAWVRTVASDELTPQEVEALRELFVAAWGAGEEAFTDEDWEHALGGRHFLVEEGGAIVSHASVVPRELHTGTHRLATGYVEAVATSPAHQGRGLGSTEVRTAEEDGGVLVRLTLATPQLDLHAPISCDWRPGDVW